MRELQRLPYRFPTPSPAGLRKPLLRERSSGAPNRPRKCFLRAPAGEIRWKAEHRSLDFDVAMAGIEELEPERTAVSRQLQSKSLHAEQVQPLGSQPLFGAERSSRQQRVLHYSRP